ncbi:unnamed protein product [Hermetia illucens]|uniref:Uncharacterized protein n=1 Tax=Hermetia illucens TaxID=343691 RepID=A0A7R8Z192_HERIL|nr:unnamed protein product [Hermetia illucens]
MLTMTFTDAVDDQPDVVMWVGFTRFEAQFCAHSVKKDNVKFDKIVSELDADILEQVYAPSEEAKIPDLVTASEIGDEKSSQLLRAMQAMSNGRLADAIIKRFGLSCLPARVQSTLPISNLNDLSELARIADRIVEISSFEHITQISPPSSAPTKPSMMQQIARNGNAGNLVRLGNLPSRKTSSHAIGLGQPQRIQKWAFVRSRSVHPVTLSDKHRSWGIRHSVLQVHQKVWTQPLDSTP